jgi:2,4-diketo-3-deoxy-L-fuconate hydrolase
MKLVRHGTAGSEKPGIIDRDGRIRDLSGHIDDIGRATLSKAGLARLVAIDLDSLPLVDVGVRLGPCVARPGNFLAVGLNYSDHAKESNMPVPTEPILFNKAPSSIAGPDDDLVLPADAIKTDWEVELAVVMAEDAWRVDRASALDLVAGYCICNDISERGWQLERGGQWMKGKSGPGFGPLGPWLVTTDEITDPQALAMFLDLNGERVQTGSTATMVFGVAELVSEISRFIRLERGDVIATGTPPGVGMAKKPPRFLRNDDVMELSIAGLGTQRQKVAFKRHRQVIDWQAQRWPAR